MLAEADSQAELEVDGGIDQETAPLVVEAGANVLVAGSAIFGATEGISSAMAQMRKVLLDLAQGSQATRT
jgi:ribulose-phosphate 3-epimerase